VKDGEQGLFIAIGKILTTHGHKGELKVQPLTDFPERFQTGEEVWLDRDGRLSKHEIETVRYHRQWIILRLSGVEDMSAAEELRGVLIKVPEDRVYPLPEGHYYIFQLVGLPVLTEEGDFLGILKEILPTGSNDVYRVCHPETGREILLPAIKDCIKSIDLEGRRILVKLLPGLID